MKTRFVLYSMTAALMLLVGCGDDFNNTGGEDTVCGDGIFEGTEKCDDGKNDGSYGGCMPGCQKKAPHCGDGIVQQEYGETCNPNVSNTSKSCESARHPMIN